MLSIFFKKKKKRIVTSEPKCTDLGIVHPYQTTAEKNTDGRKLAQSQIQLSVSHTHRSRDVTL